MKSRINTNRIETAAFVVALFSRPSSHLCRGVCF